VWSVLSGNTADGIATAVAEARSALITGEVGLDRALVVT